MCFLCLGNSSCFGCLEIYYLSFNKRPSVFYLRRQQSLLEKKNTEGLNLLCDISKFLRHPALLAAHCALFPL